MNAWDFTPYFPGTTVTAVAETPSSWLLFTTEQEDNLKYSEDHKQQIHNRQHNSSRNTTEFGRGP